MPRGVKWIGIEEKLDPGTPILMHLDRNHWRAPGWTFTELFLCFIFVCSICICYTWCGTFLLGLCLPPFNSPSSLPDVQRQLHQDTRGRGMCPRPLPTNAFHSCGHSDWLRNRGDQAHRSQSRPLAWGPGRGLWTSLLASSLTGCRDCATISLPWRAWQQSQQSRRPQETVRWIPVTLFDPQIQLRWS